MTRSAFPSQLPPGAPGVVILAQAFLAGWRRQIAIAFGASVAVLLIVWLFVTPVFEARAPLVYTPTATSDDASGAGVPAEIPLEAYAALARSPGMIDTIRREVPEVGSHQLERLRGACIAELPQAATGQPQRAPLLTLVFSHEDPEVARRFTEHWAKQLETTALALKTTSLTRLHREIQTKLAEARTALEGLTAVAVAAQNDADVAIHTLTVERDDKLAKLVRDDEITIQALVATQSEALIATTTRLANARAALAERQREARDQLAAAQRAETSTAKQRQQTALARLARDQQQRLAQERLAQGVAVTTHQQEAALSAYLKFYDTQLELGLKRTEKAELLKLLLNILEGKDDALLQRVFIEDIRARRAALEAQIASLSDVLKNLPELRTRRRTIPDTALWLLRGREEIAPKDLRVTLDDQEFNPLYERLNAQRVRLGTQRDLVVACTTAFQAAFAALKSAPPDRETALREYLVGVALANRARYPAEAPPANSEVEGPALLQESIDRLAHRYRVVSEQMLTQFESYRVLATQVIEADAQLAQLEDAQALARLTETQRWADTLAKLSESQARATLNLADRQRAETDAQKARETAELEALKAAQATALTYRTTALKIMRERARQEHDDTIARKRQELDLTRARLANEREAAAATVREYIATLHTNEQSLATATAALRVAGVVALPERAQPRYAWLWALLTFVVTFMLALGCQAMRAYLPARVEPRESATATATAAPTAAAAAPAATATRGAKDDGRDAREDGPLDGADGRGGDGRAAGVHAPSGRLTKSKA